MTLSGELALGSAKPKASGASELIAVDREHWEDLQRDDFCGPRWEAFANVMARWAVPRIQGLMRTGRIFAECRYRGLATPQHRVLRLSDDDALSIANDTVAAALRAFRTAIRKWDADGGASLRTYFFRACFMQFKSAYEKHLRFHARHAHGPLPPSVPDASLASRPDDLFDLRQRLQALPVRDRRILFALAAGCSHRSIADEFGMTQKAVESWVYRFRKRTA